MATRLSFSFNRTMTVLGTVLGMGPARSHVEVTDDRLVVRLGWGFRATVPRAAITDVRRSSGRVWGWGAHGWRGRWLVNGSSQGLVTLSIEPEQRGRVIGFPVRLRELTLSLEEPDALPRALGRGPAG